MKPEKMREMLREARLREILRPGGVAPPAVEAYQHALDILECVIRKRHLREPGATVCCRCGSPMRRASR